MSIFLKRFDGKIYISASEICSGFDMNGNATLFSKTGAAITEIKDDCIELGESHPYSSQPCEAKEAVKQPVVEAVKEPVKEEKTEKTVPFIIPQYKERKRKHNYTAEDIRNIIMYRSRGMKNREIAKKMNRPEHAISTKVKELIAEGKIENRKKRFTDADDQFIIDNYKRYYVSHIAELIGRPEGSVSNRIQKLRAEKKLIID